ncbi:MAG: 16S rRNA (uracil(1498)-N(3))-methyltransferase [Alphaproteobacteria bacterium]|nr:16S rRNA (uracil(1498)-N(3))-methyltransferase [Alphaproteobacteria bacterium]NCQ67024.1 16S rRNA (uracil(1498)-N(3))-methyltransferase [Alphaproteobacteria bacterium]NCT07621.1 16S rRNA (uracil(1498)-N(3))-methyltransferase [Alphaproteobacteria bacterium]
MGKVRLFVEASVLSQGTFVELDKKQSHYVTHVMRLGAGDSLSVFNGYDGLWKAELQGGSKKTCLLEVCEQLAPQKILPEVHLCFAPLKQHPLHFVIEKGTELGVTRFHPLLTDRTVVRAFKAEKHRLTAIEACEQCRRFHLPEFSPLQSLDQLLSSLDPEKDILYVCDERREGAQTILKQYNKSLTAYVLIGPEGGFSPQEFQKLQHQRAVRFVTLSPHVLRAETAAVSILSQLALVL